MPKNNNNRLFSDVNKNTEENILFWFYSTQIFDTFISVLSKIKAAIISDQRIEVTESRWTFKWFNTGLKLQINKKFPKTIIRLFILPRIALSNGEQSWPLQNLKIICIRSLQFCNVKSTAKGLIQRIFRWNHSWTLDVHWILHTFAQLLKINFNLWNFEALILKPSCVFSSLVKMNGWNQFLFQNKSFTLKSISLNISLANVDLHLQCLVLLFALHAIRVCPMFSSNLCAFNQHSVDRWYPDGS